MGGIVWCLRICALIGNAQPFGFLVDRHCLESCGEMFHDFRACMITITSEICALKSSLRFLDSSVMVLVISLQSLVTSLVMIFVRSFLISAMIWSQRAFAVTVLLGTGWLIGVASGCLGSPFWFLLECFCFGNLGYLSMSKVSVQLFGHQDLLSGDLFHCILLVVLLHGLLL